MTISAQSTTPIQYQWRRGGYPLQDDGRITGATTTTLTITAMTQLDAADYDCIVSNDCGGVPSLSAQVVVIRGSSDPLQAIGRAEQSLPAE